MENWQLSSPSQTSFSPAMGGHALVAPAEQRWDKHQDIVIERSVELYNQLHWSLEGYGYTVCLAKDPVAVLHSLMTQLPSLILLGPSLSSRTAFELCIDIRKRSYTPIVMFTDYTQIDPIVLAYDLGADVVIPLPFVYKEAEARIMAILRRSSLCTCYPGEPVLAVGPIALDDLAHTVTVDDQAVNLTPMDFRLLRYLMQNAEQTVTKQQLLIEFWAGDLGKSTNVVEVAIRRLRQKIERDPSQPTHLLTVKGLGYRFTQGRDRLHTNALSSAKTDRLKSYSRTPT